MYENSFTLKKMLAAYRKPLQFRGRSTRTELLGYLIVSSLLATIFGWLAIGLGMAGLASISTDPLSFPSIDIFNLLFWLPFPALAVRRFHDEGRPGWCATPIILSTIISWVSGYGLLNSQARFALALFYTAALVLLFWKPEDGANRYGADPRLDPDGSDLAPNNASTVQHSWTQDLDAG